MAGSVLPMLEPRPAAGKLRLRDALAELDVVVEPDAVVELDEGLFVSVNTPDGLRRL